MGMGERSEATDDGPHRTSAHRILQHALDIFPMMAAFKFWLAKELAEMAFGIGLFVLALLVIALFIWYDSRRTHAYDRNRNP